MKFLLCVFACVFSYAQETIPESQVPLKRAEVVFLKKKKEFAKIVIEDIASGIKSVFSSEKLDKGNFVLKIVDSCEAKKNTVIGEFFTSSGNTSSEFINEGLSVGHRHKSIEYKFVTLSKKSKNRKSSIEGCGQIKPAE